MHTRLIAAAVLGMIITVAQANIPKATGGSTVEERLGGIKIPQFEIRSAAFHDAVQFLEEQTRRFDPSKKEGVAFVIEGPKPPDAIPNDPANAFGGGKELGPLVTLSLKDISALEVLKSLMDQTGYTYTTDENTVTIIPKKQ